MNKKKLVHLIRELSSCLCVGLDTDLAKIPQKLYEEKDPVFAFNKDIIDATRPYAVAYKLNLAFYESLGPEGWHSFEKTVKYIGQDRFIIADAKRGDIGNTAAKYASTFFERYNCHAVTLSPYMGLDTVEPFLDYKDKWSIILACTSNPGAKDFEKLDVGGEALYLKIVKKFRDFTTSDQVMFVVGATQPQELRLIREAATDFFFLVPGVGAQGGSVEEVMKAAQTKDVGLLINSSRSIIYASQGEDYKEAAAQSALELQSKMAPFIAQ